MLLLLLPLLPARRLLLLMLLMPLMPLLALAGRAAALPEAAGSSMHSLREGGSCWPAGPGLGALLVMKNQRLTQRGEASTVLLPLPCCTLAPPPLRVYRNSHPATSVKAGMGEMEGER